MSENIAIGIDLGTTFSCVAVYENKKITVITNPQGSRITPSEVAFTDLEQLVGTPAKNQGAINSENTIFEIKRLMGKRYNEPSLKKDLENFPFRVIPKDSIPVVEVEFKKERKQFTPAEISGMILEEMKRTAEKHLGHEVKNAVITVPAYFNQDQRQATKDAAKLAGLNVLRLINEPTAAALAFGFEKKTPKKQKVLVFDLGGGTFDVSIVVISPGDKFEVKATTGDTHFGGSDFDQILLEHFSKKFNKKHNVDITKKARSLRRLRTACETAKRSLSEQMETTIIVDALFGELDLEYKLTRTEFEDLCKDLFKKVLNPVERALSDAKFDKSEIDEILLVGGTTRIPKIQEILKNYFNGKVLKNSINPDEAVAYGAAVQAAVLSGSLCNSFEKLVLQDITPLSIGEMMGIDEYMGKVIDRNSPIPISKIKEISNLDDNQTSILFVIYEGERAVAKKNHKLGEFWLSGITPLPRDKAEVDVTFAIDADGILTVTAEEISTGNKNSIIIEKQRLDDSDISQMIEDAEYYKKKDALFLKKVAAREKLREYVNMVHDFIEENDADLTKWDKTTLSNAEKEGLDYYLNKYATEKILILKYEEVKQICDPIIERTRIKRIHRKYAH